jgi:hypothetical protein
VNQGNNEIIAPAEIVYWKFESEVFFGGLVELLYRITAGKFLLSGVSKTTLAFI